MKKPKSTCGFRPILPIFFLFYRKNVGNHYSVVPVRENLAKKDIEYHPLCLCPSCGDDMRTIKDIIWVKRTWFSSSLGVSSHHSMRKMRFCYKEHDLVRVLH